MHQLLLFSAVIVAASFNFVGLVSSLFIAVVSYMAWLKNPGLSNFDRILFSLGITRFLMLGLLLLYVTCVFLFPDVLRSVPVATFTSLCWLFLDSSSLWFATLLNTLYCVKITNFEYCVFLLLKRNLPSKTPQLLLACVLISALTTLLYIVLRQTSPFPGSVGGRNITEFDVTADILYLVTSFVWSSSLQFIVNVMSASLLIESLKRHIQKMQRSTTHFWNPQTEAHMGAMKLMIYFLVLYIPYSVASLFLYLPSVELSLETKLAFMIISSFYQPGHSILIILTHPKMKTKAKKILCFNKEQNFNI